MADIFERMLPTYALKRMVRTRRCPLTESGASLVEFALVLPLLLVITFGIIEFGVMMYNQQVITNAAREGARRGIIQDNPRILPAEIEGVVHDAADDYVISFLATPAPPDIDVTCNEEDHGCTGTLPYGQENLTVTVTYNFQYLVIGNLVPGLGSGINLRSVATMTCE